MPETPELNLCIFFLRDRAFQKFKVILIFSSAALTLPFCAHFKVRGNVYLAHI